jgi:hypothetical protein
MPSATILPPRTQSVYSPIVHVRTALGEPLQFLTGKTRCNQVKFRCDCNPDSKSGLLGELNIEHRKTIVGY